jgi:purine-cytosine permease-like protein
MAETIIGMRGALITVIGVVMLIQWYFYQHFVSELFKMNADRDWVLKMVDVYKVVFISTFLCDVFAIIANLWLGGFWAMVLFFVVLISTVFFPAGTFYLEKFAAKKHPPPGPVVVDFSLLPLEPL